MKTDIKKAYAVLETRRRIVGVKLVKTKEEFDTFEARELYAPLSYCVCVKCAMSGAALKFTAENSGCFGSTRALGMEKPAQDFYDGSEGIMLGLYQNKSLAATVAGNMKIISTPTYGVIVKPLENFEKAPDVVLIVTDNKNLMRLIQGYTYMHGMQTNFNMIGNQAVCVECTVTPLQTETMNISMFCSGTRYLARWKNTEAMAGIPFSIFSSVIEGVRQTINPVEMDERKSVIEKKLDQAGISDMDIIYGHTYYTDFEKQKAQERKRERRRSQKSG
ncbi:MAG: DUF169 domain-containing protein [Desulfobacter sp.]|nr:DUF169 domain-containing protein [Desulfobacter sp.]